MAALFIDDFGTVGVAEDVCVCLLFLVLLVVVASIPIAMQVACNSTMASGPRALAEKQTITPRLASIEASQRMKPTHSLIQIWMVCGRL